MLLGGTTYRLITDQVGSVRLVENTSTGAVAERIDYDEFGNVLSDSAPGTQPFGFAGGLRDLDTGLTRFGARDYDSVTGRWTAKDPLSFGGGLTDLYSYVGSDPINKMDPKGLNVTNNSGCPIVVKGEEDSTGPQVIGPGQSWNYRDDGFYLPNGNVFKVPDWVDATINPDGSVTTYVSPAVPWNSTQHYKSVPGRWFWGLWGNVVGHWNNPNDPFLRKNTNWPQPGDVQRMFNSTGAGPGCGCSQ
jgi:RHS repeat-associated protein